MSDLFHKEVPRTFIDSVFDTMEAATWHTFQVLSKRSSLLRDYINNRYGKEKAPAHIWLGVSVEDGKRVGRIRHLQEASASVRFLSVEPLIGRLGQIDLKGISWVIVGGESGPGFRPMQEDWAVEILRQCQKSNVAFFFKQWGGFRPKSGGRELDGQEWNGFPHLQAAE